MVKVNTSQEDKKSPTVVVKCNCKHDFQDKKYGNGNRVANRRNSDKNKNEARCTVCGSIKSSA